ncbi:TetR/AcrR family transcriptional regulator [Corynebacterium sp. 320]|uniref:TetR/AcrR family transcriptional regulator n=1 Tax=Corynebacterium zhongnanshanii TaxID=2768834 RepID=A0ABQ6VGP8_9CORY|nr:MULTISPECIES: TetR/AcrR family transcriptional regulator [Corynebacterium]KAB1503656.1 TetR/AcrR family transcriptional regulator [Corynebacterium sp. 320]KAB1553243.1 TetR/AcrR family transcriptional regulator [Corynebacterium sp. 321]KAB1553538.1 TetR/AcrR family transcriptional regulator [Corynebacterium sp. 319]KAB3523493.1 TetR/AcrR family transcriptional regulator [Corynebacterium zhongnanshanii]KAB3527792.1 TetR/AcrR family transcriptional regulator [Corynebacterium sp. 250]
MPKVSDVDLAEKKSEILSGARHCFATYGYDGATVARLEEATGKSRGAIFHHYGNKDALFLAVAHDDMKRMADIAASEGLIGAIRVMMTDEKLNDWWGMRVEIIRRVNMDPCFSAKWELDQVSLRTTVRERLREQQHSGQLRTDVSVETMAQLLETVLEGVLARLAQGQGSTDVPATLDYVENMLRA